MHNPGALPELNARVLVLKPSLEAVNRVSALLRPAELAVEEYPLPQLPLELSRGGDVLVLDEELLVSPLVEAAALDRLIAALDAQGESPFTPVVLLQLPGIARKDAPLGERRTFCALDDPIESLTLVSVVRAALCVAATERQLRARESDITSAAATLHDAEARRAQWVAIHAHEFRNPLASIVAALELIRVATDSERPVRRAVEIVGRQVEQLTALVDQMIKAARVTPARDGPAETPVSARSADPRPASFKARRVLIVDDNADAADSLGALLAAFGAEVCVARSGEEALRVLDQFAPDSAVIDIGMPGMDGYELARRLRAAPRFQRMLIVALTGWGEPHDRQRSRQAGIDHHLVKPASVTTLNSVLERRRVDRSRPPSHS